MENARQPRRSTFAILLSLSRSILRLGARTMHLGLLYAFYSAQPWVRPFLLRLTLLGTAITIWLETIDPKFPFWSAMKLWICCALLLLIHHHMARRKSC